MQLRTLLSSFAFVVPLALCTASSASAQGTTAPTAAAPSKASAPAGKRAKKGKKGKKGKNQNKGKKGKKARRGQDRGLCAALSCSDAQAEQVRTLVQTMREGMKADRRGGQALQTALARELAKDKPSAKELARVRKELSKQRDAAEKRMFDLLLDIHALLDSGQRKELSRLVEAHGLRRMLKGGREHRRPARGASPRGRGPADGPAQRRAAPTSPR